MFISQTAAVTEVKKSTVLGTELKEQETLSISHNSFLVSIVPTCHSCRTTVLIGRGSCQCMCCTEQSVNLDGTKKQSENQTKTQTPYVTMGGV